MNKTNILKSAIQLIPQPLRIALLLVFLTIPPTVGWGIPFAQSPHGNKSNMPKGCGSCHVGHGKKRTPMLPDSEENLCYECHGGQSRAQRAEAANRLRGKTSMANIAEEFRKPFHHPVEITGAHSPREFGSAPAHIFERHAECVDCHHSHRTEPKQPSLPPGARAHKKSSLNAADPEYILCYRCHGRGSVTAPLAETTDPENEFSLGNASYHPVQGQGTGTDVPSLILPYTEDSIINCTDCHNNDNPIGPRGPHGSMYERILVRNFNEYDDNPESEFQYSLCYGCHSRTSILANQSFPLHSLHIVDQRTSCDTCHNAHGSQLYKHLIFFKPQFVLPSSGGRLEFIDMGNRTGSCFVTCHGKDHNPLSYP